MFQADQVLANQFAQCFQNIRNDIEQFLGAYLFTQRTQINLATKNGVFNSTNFAFEIGTSPEKGIFFEDAKSMMRQNYYTGVYDVIADSRTYRNARFYAAQGAQNAVNTVFQFSGMNIRESIGLNDDEYTNGAALFLPENTFAALDWIPRQNRIGRGDYNTYVGGYGSMIDPVSGLTFAVHGYTQRADTSALNGNAQDDVIEFEVSIDISANLAPISVTKIVPGTSNSTITLYETVVYEVAQV
jgi:hypothetical protein